MHPRTAILVLLLPALAAAADLPAVVELFEDDAMTLFRQLPHGGIGGGENVRIEAEAADVFAGKTALRVASMQRFNPDIEGWNHVIAEKPKPGEYRYLRFAWKKTGDGPMMIQFHTRKPVADWVIRYHAGGHPPWPAKVVAPNSPGDWRVVTRDLFADFGAVTLGGIAFTPYEGADGLFDHLLLGRTIEDLDRATAAVVLKTPPKEIPGAHQLKEFWEQLGRVEAYDGDSAVWAFVRCHKQAVPFLRETVRLPAKVDPPPPVAAEQVKPLLRDLTHYRHVTRSAATDELVRLGPAVLPHVRTALEGADGDAKDRLQAFLDGWSARTGVDLRRLRRCVAILRAVGTAEAKELLAKIEAVVP